MDKSLHSGPIWRESADTRSARVRRVCETLQSAYGRPRLGNPRESLDDLVYIILSNKTAPMMARRTFADLRRVFPRWDELLRSRPLLLKSVLRPAGLSTVKSDQIRRALSQIARDFGHCSLRPLLRWSIPEIEKYLCSLPGVSMKVAKCVMLYTMKAQVLPVDSHVHRVAMRLGWTTRRRADQCHRDLEALVPPRKRFAFHVDCIVHGRTVCRPTRPSCEGCCIRKYCRYTG